MNGHTTQLGPHEQRVEQRLPRNTEPFFNLKELKQSREHVLVLMVLLFFTANVAFVFIHYSSDPTIVDGLPPSQSLASLGTVIINFLSI